jgi:hypothetical protein
MKPFFNFYFFNLFFILLFLPINAHDKWIVVTTIHYPTPALEKLSQLPGWRLVVVADKKTPHDWHLDNCDFLSVEMQEKLNFNIIKHLPWNHYSRKNIGYLYAIKNGARIIYETDDDTQLDTGNIFYLPEYISGLLVTSNYHLFNPHAYFGQPSTWPRGYPLSAILKSHDYTYQKYHQIFVPIQQALVNLDPDVDAIFRLTHRENTFFDSAKPPISLANSTFCPFNTQNTIFHYAAFWGLLIPIKVPFRVSDIWRSYWVQRIIHDIDGHLCFLPATTTQYRNEHDLMKDFIDEYDLYTKAGDFVSFLASWHGKGVLLSERMLNLMTNLVNAEFFAADEVALLKAWIADLEYCGYHMPKPIV